MAHEQLYNELSEYIRLSYEKHYKTIYEFSEYRKNLEQGNLIDNEYSDRIDAINTSRCKYMEMLVLSKRASDASEFIDYHPQKTVKQSLLKQAHLKSFNPPKSSKSPTHPSQPHSGRRSTFMHVFGIDVLNKDELVVFTRAMKSFMVELDYNPEDKDDVALFYTQENPSDLYDVYLARKVKTIGKYMNVFGINPEYYDNVFEFIQLVKKYILSDKNLASKYNAAEHDYTTLWRIMNPDEPVWNVEKLAIKVPDVLAFFRQENADDVYMNIKLANLSVV
jgi:hypothetical protein